MIIFIKNVPMQFARTYTVMLVCFTAIGCAKGVELVPVARLLELALLAVVGGFLMEVAFGRCIFKRTAYSKRVCVFIIPFAAATYAFAAGFQWVPGMALGDYLKLAGLFVVCGLLSVSLFEIEHWVRGRKYTGKLRDYQNRKEHEYDK